MGKHAYNTSMGKSIKPVTRGLREAIKASGVSRYRIGKDLGISEALLSRFMSGQRGLSLAVLDPLCGYLGLELRKSKRKGA